MGRGVRVAVPTVLGALACAGAAAAQAAPPPEAYGPHRVEHRRVRVPVPVDPRGPEGAITSLAADVYAPAGARRRPVVHLSHGWPGTLRQFPLSGWAGGSPRAGSW